MVSHTWHVFLLCPIQGGANEDPGPNPTTYFDHLVKPFERISKSQHLMFQFSSDNLSQARQLMKGVMCVPGA